MDFNHESVMLTETIEQLQIKPNGTYLDGTLGGGGHAFEICGKLEKGRLFGMDQDDAAIEAARLHLAPYREKVTIIRSNYRDAKRILNEMGVYELDGILMDLGVSSHQLDESTRGFSYRYDGDLDMRMDRRQPLTAKEIVNQYTERDLFCLIRDYGEDRFAKNIAKHMVLAREKKPITTTMELSEIIKRAIPAKMRQSGHPAKKTFQAIRIECNQELEVLRDSLDMLMDMLKPGGRICIITFHSLEDRIVKTAFKKKEDPCICPDGFPVCACGKKPEGKVITRKPILPEQKEQEANSRSKSAKLRTFEKI